MAQNDARKPGPTGQSGVADKLQQSLRTALADPDVLAGLQKLGIETPPAMSAAQFRELVQRDLSKWAAVVKRAKISTES